MTTNLLDKMTVQEQIYALDNEVSAQDDKITSATETANSAMTRADGAQDTANSAMTRADSAQATANSAQTRADSAQADANTAKQSANQANYGLSILDQKVTAIAPFDTAPTEGSLKGVTSGGVYEAIQAGGGLTIDVITDKFSFATGIEKYAGEILKLNNKLILFQLEIKNTNSSSASSIGIMPSGTYPAETCAICTGNSSSNYLSYAFVSASGAVIANRQSIPANSYGWFFGTYAISGGA